MNTNSIIWRPSAARVEQSAMFRFLQAQGFAEYGDLHQWSIDDAPAFWTELCNFCDIQFDRQPNTVLLDPENMMRSGWFDGAKLNFAAHLLRHTGDEAAIVFCGEDGARRVLSRDELRSNVAPATARPRSTGTGTREPRESAAPGVRTF